MYVWHMLNAVQCSNNDTRLKGYHPLAVLNCAMLSVTTICSTRTPSLHYLILYFLPVWEGRGRQSHLTAAKCQVSAGPPRRGMFTGQSDRKPPKVNPPNMHLTPYMSDEM